MSKENRKRVYDKLVELKHWHRISEPLKKEFGDPTPKPEPLKKEPTKKKGGK